MPISKEEYESGLTDSKLLELFTNNPNSAYSLTELIRQFGRDITIELDFLHVKDIISAHMVTNPDTAKRDLFFMLAEEPQTKP